MHRRTLNILRKEVQPVPIYAYAEFLRQWHNVGAGAVSTREFAATGGVDSAVSDRMRLHRVIQQLRGLAIPGVIWERDVLPARIPDFDASTLADACQSGEIMWTAEGGRDARRARIRFFFRGEGGIFLDRRPVETVIEALSAPARAVHDYLADEGAALLADIADGVELNRADVQAALVELVLAGLVTNDSLDALHAILGFEPTPSAQQRPVSSLEAQLAALLPSDRRPRTRHRRREARLHARQVVMADGRARRTPWIGRWTLVHRSPLLGKPLSDEDRASRQARQLLARWGVVTKACLEREPPRFDWGSVYTALSRMEMRGEVRRGYFVEGLPGIQFALTDVVELLRAANRDRGRENGRPAPGDGVSAPLAVLNAADPAQLFGGDAFGGPLRFQRVASSAVALHAGQPIAVMEDNGAEITSLPDHPALVSALRALAQWWKPRGGGRVRVERWHGEPVLESAGVSVLEAAGFVREYGGMLWIG
jgi:ATP-dependent Lhr-like helicase